MRVGDWGGYMLADCNDPLTVHKFCSMLPAFEFQARPVISVEDAIRGLDITTPLGKESFYDEGAIRKAALSCGIPCITTLSGSRAAVDAIRTLLTGEWTVESLQELLAAGRVAKASVLYSHI